jgi:FkbM family methyltransferase
MSLSHKLSTAGALVIHGRWDTIVQQFRAHWRAHRLRRSGSRPFVHRTAGFPLVCFPDMPDSCSQYLHGADDRWEVELLRDWLCPGDAFIDAGANLGLYAHAIASHFSGRVRVLAVEPSPYLVGRLTEAADRLRESGLKAVQSAAGHETGETDFFIARPGLTTVSQSIRMEAESVSDYELHRVPMDTLGGLSSAYLGDARVAAVKLDVEGAEPLAVKGAPASWLSADGPLWLIEINVPVLARMGFGASDVIRWFPVPSFERWLVPKYPYSTGVEPRPRQVSERDDFCDARFYNFVAVPSGPAQAERRARVLTLFQHKRDRPIAAPPR